MNRIKNLLRKIALLSPIAVTKNIRYDRESKQILKRILNPDSNCIDVGCHKGEFLDMIISFAPNGKHYGFEPIPELYDFLKVKYGKNQSIHHVALSNRQGQLSFQHVRNFPAYSGFQKRHYDGKDVEIEEITVQAEMLDSILKNDFPIDVIKIDVEGAEFQVLQGARNSIERWKPHVIFEFGKGAADHYETTPQLIHQFFDDVGMSVNTLRGWLNSGKPLSIEALNAHFDSGDEYYFIAFPKKSKN